MADRAVPDVNSETQQLRTGDPNPQLIIWNQYFQNLQRSIPMEHAARLRDAQLLMGRPMTRDELYDKHLELGRQLHESQVAMKLVIPAKQQAYQEQAKATARAEQPPARQPTLFERIGRVVAKPFERLFTTQTQQRTPEARWDKAEDFQAHMMAQSDPDVQKWSRHHHEVSLAHETVRDAYHVAEWGIVPPQSLDENAEFQRSVDDLYRLRLEANTNPEYAMPIRNAEMLLGGHVEEKEQFDYALAHLQKEYSQTLREIESIKQDGVRLDRAAHLLTERDKATLEMMRCRRDMSPLFTPRAEVLRMEEANRRVIDLGRQLARECRVSGHADLKSQMTQHRMDEAKLGLLQERLKHLEGPMKIMEQARAACIQMEREERYLQKGADSMERGA